MTKIKITTLTDKIKDEEILSKLKSIGVKIKDKEKEREEQALSETTKSTASGETIIEKRVASTIIRRRVQAPPVAEVVQDIKEEPQKPVLEVAEAQKRAPVKKYCRRTRRNGRRAGHRSRQSGKTRRESARAAPDRND